MLTKIIFVKYMLQQGKFHNFVFLPPKFVAMVENNVL